jgi:fibronectin-binding autotransporter adhesin
MSCRNTCASRCFPNSSSCKNHRRLSPLRKAAFGWRRVPGTLRVAAGLAVLAAMLLADPGAARAQIGMNNVSSGTLAASATELSHSVTVPYSVAAGNVLVVQFDSYTSNGTGADVTPTITWNGTPLTPLIEQTASAAGFPNADIFYASNPFVGSGNLVFSFTGRSAAFGAMGLSGVNTFATPLVMSASANTTISSATFSGTNAATTNGSFAVVDEGQRVSSTSLGNTFSLGSNAAGASPGQSWNYFDGVQYEAGGGTVANIPAGTFTISATSTGYGGGAAFRNVLAAAVFTPVTPSVMTWTGTAGSGNWDINTAKNWQGQHGVYLEPNLGAVFDDTAGTSAGTTSVVVAQGVSPASVTFSNSAYNYAFTSSGGGAISGTGAVTVQGTGKVAFNLANAYSGGTTVSSGSLQIGNAAGSATGSGPVSIGANGTLMGGGLINAGANTVTVNGSIAPYAGSFGTLGVAASQLQLNGVSNLDLNGASLTNHDLINVTGGLSLGGTISVANLSGSWSSGIYPLIDYTGSLTNNNPTLSIVNTFGSTLQFSLFTGNAGVIDLKALALSATKTWTGAVASGGYGAWNINSTPNWKTGGGTATYSDTNPADTVLFDNTAQNFGVTLTAHVNPTAVVFANSANSYDLNGSGGIDSAAGGVLISGGGTVSFENNNNYTAVTTVSNGSTFLVNGFLNHSTVVVNGSFIGGSGDLGGPLNLNGATGLSAGSDLSVFGATTVSGTFTIPAGSTFDGNGGLTVQSGGQLTLNGNTVAGQTITLNSATLSGSGVVNGPANLSSATLATAGTLNLNGPISLSGTSSIASGLISSAGSWTGTGAFNVPGGTELLLGGGASTGSGVTLNVAGILTGSGGPLNGPINVSGSALFNVSGAVNGSVNAFGSPLVSISSGNVPSLIASGGTINLAGPTVTSANISGNALVNITSGSVLSLNVASSDLNSGVTVGAGASAGGTSLSVSGGLVTLNNTNTIPTATISGGTTNFNGPTVTAAAVSGGDVIVNAGSLSTLSVSGNTTLVTVGLAASAGGTLLSVSGGLVTLNNTNTIPTATISGGTVALAGPNVTAAGISGGAVNVTAGSVLTLNVGGNLTNVSVGAGASAGSTSLSVSGGMLTLNNTNTIPTATLTGGTTTFAGPNLTTAAVSGNALVVVNSGNLATLNASGSATTTVAAGVTLNNPYISGGLVNLNNANAMSSLIVAGGSVTVASNNPLPLLAVSGGTVNLPAGTTTVSTANFGAAGAATTVTPNLLVVSNQLTFNGGAAATISNGNSFTYATSGGNLANTSAASTLTLSGGVLTFSPSLSAGAAINVDTAQTAYTGTGPSPDIGTKWNSPAANASGVALLNSAGGTTSVIYTQMGQNGTAGSGNPNSVLSTFSYANAGSRTENFTFGGLTPGAAYNLYAIMLNNIGGRASLFTTGGLSQTITSPAAALIPTVPITSSSVYCEFSGQIANSNGQINVLVSTPPAGGEANVNGFQLIPFNAPTGAVSLPSANIAATANSTLDFSGAGPANVLGGLMLGGNVTVQNVASGGRVQFGGDVIASTNATVALAAGAGSTPTLVLSGNSGGVQNISTANSFVLNLPALAVSAGTVNVGNPTGYNGSVVLNGATALTATSGATVNVNAGMLKVGGALSGAAGSMVVVNSGATLVGEPAAAIQVPVTVNSGGVLLPDATGASTGLIGNNLTINAGGIFQWVYSGTGAKGTLALGGSLSLPSSGNPVFRPQLISAPAVGTYVMTWSSPPVNQPSWTFDGSLASGGNAAVWGDSNGGWDTGSNWNYPSYTAATLSYTTNGLQLASLTVVNVPGTAAPPTGASVTISPPSASSISVTGPAAPASPGALIIQGSGAATATLTLQSTGPISPTSVGVYAGGALNDDGGSGIGALNLPAGALAISGGSVSLQNASTSVSAATINSGLLSLGGGSVGTLTASGGAITIGGAAVGNAQIAGSALLNVNNSGSVLALAVNGGSATVASTATVGAATVTAGGASFNNTGAMNSLTVSGGTAGSNGGNITTTLVNGGIFNAANTSIGTMTLAGAGIFNPANTTIGAFTQSSGTTTVGVAVTVGSADLSAGAGTFNAVTPVSVTGALKLANSVTATVTSGGSFTASSVNLANTAITNTFTLARGTLSLGTPSQGNVVNVVTAGVAYTGPGPASDAGTTWNNPGENASANGLLNSLGATTSVAYSAVALSQGTTTANGRYFTNNPISLLDWYQYDNVNSQVFTFSGLNPALKYEMYAICNSNAPNRATQFTVGSATQKVTTQGNFASVGVTAPTTYALFTGLVPSGSNNQIVVTSSGTPQLENDINGLQLVSLYPLAFNTNIAAAATSTLNIPSAGAQVTLGSLTLSATASPALTLSGFASLTLSPSGGAPAISAAGPSGAASVSGLIPIQIASGNVNVDAGASLSVAATFQDGASATALTKVGGGTLSLGAANTYSGATTANGGVFAAGAANVLSPNSNVFVGTNATAGTLDVTAGSQSVNALTIGSLGSLNVTIGSPLASPTSVTLAGSSNMNLFGAIPTTPELLLTFGTLAGRFGSVFDNGSPVPAGDLHYSSNSISVYALPFSGAGTWLGTATNWSSATGWTDGTNNGVPGDGSRGVGVDTATFNGMGSVTAVNLDIFANLAALNFSGTNYTLSGGGALTMQSTAGTSYVTVSNGTQTIANSMTIAGGSLAIAVNGNGVLNISGNIYDDNGLESLTLNGDGTGQLVLSGANNYGGGTNVLAGTLVLDSASALVDGSSLTVGQGALSLFAPAAGLSLASSEAGATAVPEPGALILSIAALLIAALRSAVLYRRVRARGAPCG